MQIKAAIFDIDGTLVSVGSNAPSERTLAALRALQQAGVRVIVATGRAPFAARAILGGFMPDYLVTTCGSRLERGDKCLYERLITPEEMYALVDFCEDDNIPLMFTFSDGYYAYTECAALHKLYERFGASAEFLHDGEDQIRHLNDMPFGGGIVISQAQREAFAAQYGHLGVRFLPFHEDFCDLLCSGVDKSVALERALADCGVAWENAAAFGDGGNDVQMLERAGFSAAPQSATKAAIAAAKQLCPPCKQDGVAQAIEQYILLQG